MKQMILQFLIQKPWLVKVKEVPDDRYQGDNILCSCCCGPKWKICKETGQSISDFVQVEYYGAQKCDVTKELLHTCKQQKNSDNMINSKLLYNEVKTTNRWCNS